MEVQHGIAEKAVHPTPCPSFLSTGLGLNSDPVFHKVSDLGQAPKVVCAGRRQGVLGFAIFVFSHSHSVFGTGFMPSRSWPISRAYVLCFQSSLQPPCPSPLVFPSALR